jgi:antitoxin component YwqK of YwqJK toxin-antitoxin module
MSPRRPLFACVPFFLILILLVAAASSAPPARAGNGPESGQRRLEEDVLPKVVLACGVPFALKFDGDSLRKHNQDILHDQTDGRSECAEPLRYLWYACKSDAGRAKVKAAQISKIACVGAPGPTGSLTLTAGTITVSRAFEEKEPFQRSRKQFESLLKVHLEPSMDDPYVDEDWHALEQQPNPVTSTATYCLVNGEKVEWNENVYDPFCRRKQDAKVKCWKDKELVIDLDVRQGRKISGFVTHFNAKTRWSVAYRDDKEHGDQKTIEDGKLKSQAWYESGQRVWAKEFHPSGKLARYSRKFPDGYGELTVHEDGKVYRLRCSPGARDDTELRRWCGFGSPATTSIYDGTGKIAAVQTWKDGVIQKEGAGSSDYAARVDVAFKDGKKHGVERQFAKDGNLASTITWDSGIKHGPERLYAQSGKDAGKKVVKEILWKAGEIQQSTELYLNGNPKLEEVFDGPRRKRTKELWDSGKPAREGAWVLCDGRDGYRDWCEEGVHRSYFESGAPETETAFHLGKRQGPSRSWWKNGRPASVEDYADDRRLAAKTWGEDGKLLTDEEFEADGSRKLAR